MKNILPEFQSFLVSNKLLPERNVSYCACWVHKFIIYSNNHEELPINTRIQKFLKNLEDERNIADWQIKQAETAIKLYINKFLDGKISNLSPNNPKKEGQINFNSSDTINKMREAIRIKHYSYRTERSYLDWIKRFFAYISDLKKKDILYEKLDSNDVKDYLTYLAINKEVSASTQNQAFNALLFLFREILHIDFSNLNKTLRAKRGPKLPVVLSEKEVQSLFNHVHKRYQLIIKLIYGAGLRLMELVRLRVQDIDFDSNLIFVRSGKGDKDRSVMLPESIKVQLCQHLKSVKPLHEKDISMGYGEVYLPNALERKYPNASRKWSWQYVFPSEKLSVDPRNGKVRRHHIYEKSIQRVVRIASEKANIAKHVTVHTLRHSFAIHLLMNGVNIREIQELLGHKNIETTMVYTHVLRDMSNIPKSPLDKLYADVSLL